MLRLIYNATPAGAPSEYGGAVDQLMSAAGALQPFPKAQAGFIAPSPALTGAIEAWLAQRGHRPDPVIVMVHGYLFDPSQDIDTDPNSPFSSVYGMPPAPDYHMSWLPLVGECDQSGASLAENAIAFCYKSQAGSGEFVRAGWNNSYQYAVFDQAPLAARALASILAAVASHPVTVRVLAHSLGTRTFSQAIRLLRARMPGNLDRAVLLDGAEFSVDAAANFEGCPFDVINIANRSDRVLLLGAQQMCHPFRATGTLESRVIGYDGLGTIDRWIDLQLDDPALITWLANGNAPDGIPYTVEALAKEESHPFAGLDHWSCYTNDNNRSLLRDLLLSDLMTAAQLRAHHVPGKVASIAYGLFKQVSPPLTPQSRLERQRLLGPGDFQGGGAG